LYDVALRFANDLPANERTEIVDQTIVELFCRLVGSPDAQQPAAIRNPGAFLAVAAQQLRNVVRKWRRDILSCWDEWAERQVGSLADDPEQRAAEREFRQRVRQCFARSLQRHPRARLQLWVVWRKQVDALDYPEISAELNMTIRNVRVLHTRGLGHLRGDAEWRDLALESGLIEVTPTARPHLAAASKGA
jgi:DNA-directed RNA polymerase specialized sigma24 family protein